MTSRRVIDVSTLPTYAFGHRSIMWWATMGLVVIETTMFGLLLGAYFYLAGREQQWPPEPLRPPDLLWGTLNTLVLLASCVPNQIYKNAAERLDAGRTKLWLVVSLGFAVLFLGLRILEFSALNCSWATTAYGSVVYAILGFHTVHLLTDALDTGVLTALLFAGHTQPKRFVDVAENSFYWYFVVLVWLPLYAVVYWAPRLL